MKYSVLVALLGTASAKHHHRHHSLSQLDTPADSRAAWDATRNESRAVAAEQQRFQAEHNAMVKKNFDDDTAATDARVARISQGYYHTLNGSNSFVQTSDPLGKANETFVPSKEAAAKVVADQQAFEAAKTADVAARNDANTNAADTLKTHVRTLRDNQSQGEAPLDNHPTRANWTGRPPPAFVQTSAPFGNADEQFQQWRQQQAAVVAKQQASEAANTAQDASNKSNEASATASLRAHVSGARDRQAQGDAPADRFQWQHYPVSFIQTQDNEADVSYQRDRVTAANVVATQQKFEAAKTADVAARNDANTKECHDLRTHVVTTHEDRLRYYDPNVQMVYIPEEEIYLSLY